MVLFPKQSALNSEFWYSQPICNNWENCRLYLLSAFYVPGTVLCTGDRREQDKAPVSYGTELVNGETDNNTRKQVNTHIVRPTKIMLLRKVTQNVKGSAGLLCYWQ